MVSKKEDNTGEGSEEDLGTDKTSEGFKLGISTIILSIVLIAIFIIFFYLVSSKTGSDFGFTQIMFSILAALIATLFLRWIKFLIKKNPYLGLIIGFLGLGGSLNAVSQKFSGPNTTVFKIITSLIVLIYLFIHFWKSRKQNSN